MHATTSAFRFRHAVLACALALPLTAGTLFASEPEHHDGPAPTREMREKMAATHEKMAACLRSERPIKECHEEMMKAHEGMHDKMHDEWHDKMHHEMMDKEKAEHESSGK